MDLYAKSRRGFSKGLFENPTAEFRGAPFWAWNNKLDKAQVLRQLEVFGRMGMGGAHLHCRTGMGTEYLGKEFLDIVRACTERAKQLGLLTWLYDEDRWPSGAAGGLVTKDKRFRAKHLLFTPTPYSRDRSGGQRVNEAQSKGARTENGELLAVYAVRLDGEGCLAGYRRVDAKAKAEAGETMWYAYLETATESGWFNNQTYVDTLDPRAIKRFVEITHERYKKAVGKDFGGAVPAIFTDEPQFSRKSVLGDGWAKTDVVLPWTGDLGETYWKEYGAELLETLPEVMWDWPGRRASVARYRYHDHVAERFAAAFADTIGAWCQKNGIALTGHMMEEATLESQTHALGEAMRSYRGFDIPGIDMLCDAREYTTAKQAQSACHQYGRAGVMSELYGVTGWHFDFVGHKRQGDWQAALGVTLRVPHLAWVSMAGEAKRDYPAAIGYQSPWFEEYKLIEDHFARVNVALTRGRPVVRVGVIHPIESFWLCYGPRAQTRLEREQREVQFASLTEWLLFAPVDFNFICESLLPTQGGDAKGGTFGVGKMAYEVVIVPGMRTIRGTTLERLEAFAEAGGRVIFVGEVPTLVDAVESNRAQRLAEECERVGFEKVAVAEALRECQDVRIDPGHVGSWGEAGANMFSLLYQLRADGAKRYLFVCNTDRERGRGQTGIRVRGQWAVRVMNTVDAMVADAAASYEGGWTRVAWDAPAAGSLLLELTPGRRTKGVSLREKKWTEAGRVEMPVGGVRVTLSEPNVLVLDQAEWRIDGGKWQGREEILRLDDVVREKLGMRKREGHMAQPWVDKAKDPVVGMLELRFKVVAEVAVKAPLLAVEEAGVVEVIFDGKAAKREITGWWTDEAIETVRLPGFEPGVHELRLKIPMTRKRNVEWCYLLGDFGVVVSGREARITRKVRRLAWGDWTTQGLPFYGGNVTYHFDLPAVGGETALEIPHFASPVMAVNVDGRRVGAIGVPPFRVALPKSSKTAAVTVYGNRANAFGLLHSTNPFLKWYGPQAWRSTGENWAYEYQLKAMGILTAPVVKKET